MAKSESLYMTQAPVMGSALIQPADTTTLKTVYTVGADGCKITCLQAVSDDSSARVLNIYINNGSDVLLGAVNVPITSGITGLIAAVDLLTATLFPGLAYDAMGKKVILLPAGSVIKVSSQTTVTTGKTITITLFGETYTA